LPRPVSAYVEDALQPLSTRSAIHLLEIPADFQTLKASDSGLALEWRFHVRQVFEDLFSQGYLVTDFVHLPGLLSRSFYVLSHGESTL
jgi:predicted GNAT superfamily acetyltransferase